MLVRNAQIPVLGLNPKLDASVESLQDNHLRGQQECIVRAQEVKEREA